MVKKIFFYVLATVCGILFLIFSIAYLSPASDAFRVSMIPAVIFGALTAFLIWGGKSSTHRGKTVGPELRKRIEEVLSISELPVVSHPVSVILQSGEICHFQTSAETVVVKEQVVGYNRGSGGVSLRVIKGITLHSGNSRGTPIRDDVVKKYPGTFTITNQRFIMSGEKGFEFPVSKLTAVEPWRGYTGTVLQCSNKTYIVTMPEPYWVPKIVELLTENGGEK